MSVPKLLYTLEEATEATSIKRSRLYELMRTGELESVTIGRSRRIPAEALTDFVQRQRDGAPEAPHEVAP